MTESDERTAPGQTTPTDSVQRLKRNAVGTFGVNEHGLQDLAGNVWEWTSTCYVRHRLDTGTTAENCGVRIAEGRRSSSTMPTMRRPVS